MAEQIKDYLGYENDRNKKHAAMYVEIIKRAFGERVEVLIGHHLTFEVNGDLNTENEIPSADTLMFDHDIMQRVFGNRCMGVMQRLAAAPCSQRDDRLRNELAVHDSMMLAERETLEAAYP